MYSTHHGGSCLSSTMTVVDIYILLLAKKNRCTTASGKSVSCCHRQADISKNCRQEFASQENIHPKTCVCVPLSKIHRKTSLHQFRQRRSWTDNDRACVLFFSDESRFILSPDCRRQVIWHESGNGYHPKIYP